MKPSERRELHEALDHAVDAYEENEGALEIQSNQRAEMACGPVDVTITIVAHGATPGTRGTTT